MMKLSLFPTRIPVILSFFLAIIVGLVPEITHRKSALSAEKVRLVYGMFNCSLSVETLETYAKTGKITRTFEKNQKGMQQRHRHLQAFMQTCMSAR